MCVVIHTIAYFGHCQFRLNVSTVIHSFSSFRQNLPENGLRSTGAFLKVYMNKYNRAQKPECVAINGIYFDIFNYLVNEV